MAAKAPQFDDLKSEYQHLWATCELLPSKLPDIEATAGKVISGKNGRYKAVQKATGVPWFVVGVIHQLECGGKFDKHLHNGDTLAKRTTHVPKGRPKAGAPPFTWKDSAVDALTMHDLDKVEDWSAERICYELERYNGFGYRQYHSSVLTPYLWSGTNHYARGKYESDGQWNGTLVSGQSGAMAILKVVAEKDADVREALGERPEVETPAPAAPGFPKAPAAPPPVVKTVAGSRTLWAQITLVVGGICGVLTDYLRDAFDWVMWALGILPSVADDARQALSPAQEMGEWFHLNTKSIAITVAGVAILVSFVRHLDLKRKAGS